MPVYEYRCDVCGERFEKLVRSSSTDQAVACPRCGKQEVSRQFSVVASIAGRASRSSSDCAPFG